MLRFDIFVPLSVNLCLAPVIAFPGVNRDYEVYHTGILNVYSYSSFVLSIQYLKLYALIEFLEYNSSWTNIKAQQYCSINGADADFPFMTKVYMRLYPNPTLLLVVIITIFVYGTFALIYERQASNEFMNDYSNSFWLCILIFTTIGYGDIIPITPVGRLLTILLMLWGIAIFSMFISSTKNYF